MFWRVRTGGELRCSGGLELGRTNVFWRVRTGGELRCSGGLELGGN